jgi:hypothetical protein
MAGRPTRRAAAGKKPGERAQEQRDSAIAAVVSYGTQKGRGTKDDESSMSNPVLEAMQEREEAYRVLVQEQVREAQDIASGRTVITDEMCREAIQLLAAGMPLYDACAGKGYSFTGVYQRIMRTPELNQAYTAAREMYAHGAVERIKHLAKVEPDPQRARLLIDTLKWETSKVLPKFYGDKITHEAGEGITFSMNIGQSATKKGRQAVK